MRKEFMVKRIVPFLLFLCCTFSFISLKPILGIMGLVERFAKEKVSAQEEAYIRSIAKELNTRKDFSICRMNEDAAAQHGAVNACALGNVLLIGPHFFNELSEPQKRFLIGRELIHIEENHTLTNWLYYASIPCVALGPCNILADYIVPQANKKWSWFIRGSLIASGLLGTYLLSAKVSRFNEFEADREAALRLNEINGGVSFYKTYAQYYSYYDGASLWKRLLIPYPTCKQRIAQLESLQK
jgi:Zn-dependent protease with chaperone function